MQLSSTDIKCMAVFIKFWGWFPAYNNRALMCSPCTTQILRLYNWSLQSFSQDYWLSFAHHLCCVCANFIPEWRDLQFKVDSERQIFLRNFSWQFYSHSEFILLRGKLPNKYFLYFVLMSGLGLEPWLYV